MLIAPAAATPPAATPPAPHRTRRAAPDADAAVAAACRAVALVEPLTLPPHAAASRAVLGEALAAAGDAEAAAAELQAAADGFAGLRRCGAPTPRPPARSAGLGGRVAGRVERARRRASRRARRADRRASARSRRLVAAGAANKEIGAALHLLAEDGRQPSSTRIYAKLGLRGSARAGGASVGGSASPTTGLQARFMRVRLPRSALGDRSRYHAATQRAARRCCWRPSAGAARRTRRRTGAAGALLAARSGGSLLQRSRVAAASVAHHCSARSAALVLQRACAPPGRLRPSGAGSRAGPRTGSPAATVSSRSPSSTRSALTHLEAYSLPARVEWAGGSFPPGS